MSLTEQGRKSHNARNRAYYARHLEKMHEKARLYHASHVEEAAAKYRQRISENQNYLSEQYAKHRTTHLERSNAYAKKHYEQVLERAKNWYKNNKNKKRAYDEKRRIEKRTLYRAASKRWTANNPGRKNADTQARRAQLALRQPAWQENSGLYAFYESAARVTQCVGIRHCVDHIIPLRGKAVSGLHVPGNLRIIPELLNLRKGNHFSLSPDGHIA